ncbi:MAG: hypothetical protein ACAI25_21300 [Planctomycetota bacterium]
MLFSNEDIAALLNDRFECSWESVRKVPTLEIDFGDGRKLKRTLNGNVATYLCTSEGKVFDIVPGIGKAEEYRGRVELGLRFHETIARLDAKSRPEAVANYHRVMKDRTAASRRDLEDVAKWERMKPDVSKRVVEKRIKDAIKGSADLIVARAEAAKDRPRIADGSKSGVERPIKDSLHEDSEFNDAERAPKIHALLAGKALEPVSSFTKPLYKDVLGVDLDDPYLGLAPYVLGGEPGRSSP